MNTNLSLQIPNSELPQGWRWVKLGEVCVSTENRDPRTTPDLPFRYVDISSIDNRSKRIREARTIQGKDAPSRAKQIIKANDVLVATTRPNLNAVALVPEELDSEVCSTGFSVLRPTQLIDPSFLFAFVQTRYFIETVSGAVKGMLYPAVTDKQVRNVYLPLPALADQRRIARRIQELMQEVEGARAACEKQLEAAKALPSAHLRAVFESEESKKWERKKLGEVCEFEYGSGLPDRDRLGGSFPVFGSNGVIGHHNVPITKGPTVVIGRKGSIGQVNYSEVPCWPIDTTYYIDASKTNHDLIWLYWLLRWLQLDSLNKATGVPGLNREDAYKLIVPLPSIPVQRNIATQLKEKMVHIEHLQSVIQNQQSAFDALPRAILRQAFNGEL